MGSVSHKAMKTNSNLEFNMKLKRKILREFSRFLSEGRLRLSEVEIQSVLHHLKTTALKPAFGHIRDFLALLHSVLFDGYQISAEVIKTIVAALLYLIWTFDAIPDFTPLIGLTDDLLVLLTAARLCAVELENFRQWKHKNK